MTTPSKKHATIASLSWWTRRRSILQAMMIYIVMLIPGTILASAIGVLITQVLSESQSLYIGPWLNLFFSVGITLIISQHKSRRIRLLCAIVCAMVALMGRGAIITLLVPAIVSMLPNSDTFEQ